MLHHAARLALVATLAACSGVTTGNDQVVLIVSDPQGAACSVSRDGAELARIPFTPMSVRIPSSERAIDITCETQGFAPVTRTVASQTPIGSLGRHVAGGSVGRKIDRFTLTEFRYPGTVMIAIDPRAPRGGPLPLAF